MPTRINDRLVSWASDIEAGTLRQAEATSRVPVLAGHVALMPDAHVGIGATVGSVVPTEGALMPSCAGVDLGCGMIAARLDAGAEALPDDLAGLLGHISDAVPAGVGRGHGRSARRADAWLSNHRPATDLSADLLATAGRQLGSLGSGNHFLEVCLDEAERIWVVLHSGSRGIGNKLAQAHIAEARRLAKAERLALEDPDLAWLAQGTPAFDAYVADMNWAQDYALLNRELMMDAAMTEVLAVVPGAREAERINCHHNFSAKEVFAGREIWVTRKGAIRARVGDRGVVPGSMGTSTYIVAGLGNEASWSSCAHGAGRRMSRGEARRSLDPESLREAMSGRAWLEARAGSLVDEHPSAYKDIEAVMADQSDLVQVEHVLRQVLNYKG